jgi:hypothetical protein
MSSSGGEAKTMTGPRPSLQTVHASASDSPHTKGLYTLDPWWSDNVNYDWCRETQLQPEFWEADSAPPNDAKLFVTLDNYYMPTVERAIRLVNSQVPVLILADGILEYRNTWEHPQIAAGAMFQPVIGHKIACIGRAQARMLESWGNLGKCEVVGLPRLDSLIGTKPRIRPANTPWRVLVSTAKTPYFTAEHRQALLQGLRDLLETIRHSLSAPATEKIESIWRVPSELADEISLPQEWRDQGKSLAQTLATVDATISTPSTVLLESMLMGLPTAILDYTNVPQFVSAAWTISAASHLPLVLDELRSPSEPKLLFQRYVLHDQLECRSPATPRLARLVREIMRLGDSCRNNGGPLELPSRILPLDHGEHHMPDVSFDMRRLYPDHPVFSQMDRSILQVEVEQLRHEAHVIRQEVFQLRQENHGLKRALKRFEEHPILGRMLRTRRWVQKQFRRD